MYDLKSIHNLFKSREKWVKKPLLIAVERAQIVALHMESLSEKQIAKRLHYNKSSVHRAIEKFKKNQIHDDIKKLVDPVNFTMI